MYTVGNIKTPPALFRANTRTQEKYTWLYPKAYYLFIISSHDECWIMIYYVHVYSFLCVHCAIYHIFPNLENLKAWHTVLNE